MQHWQHLARPGGDLLDPAEAFWTQLQYFELLQAPGQPSSQVHNTAAMSARQKRQGLFLPSEQCLGGAMELNEAYSHFFHSAGAAQQQRVVSQQRASQPTAQQLSLQRARKLAESNPTHHNHAANLHHLARRMAETRSSSAMPWADASRRGTTARHDPSPAMLMCPWLPATILANSRADADTSRRRPATAPGKLTCSSSSSSREGMTDWQQLKQRQRPVPRPPVQPVELPPSRFYQTGPPLLPTVQHRLYKASIMSDILQRQLYRARDIRALCDAYIEVNPLEHRELLRQVVAEVKRELEIKT